MNRAEMLKQITQNPTQIWDVVVIGGGASGLGTALEATSRGYKTLLLEAYDFAKGTSSRSTKLVHGGVRYLAQGNISLVREALLERGYLRKNAPHLVHNQAFIIPAYTWWEKPFYGMGMKIYDSLAGKLGLISSKIIPKSTVVRTFTTLKQKYLQGGVLYYDGQFDDTRLAINLAQTIVENGGTVLNYAPVIALQKDSNNKLNGLIFNDLEINQTFIIKAKAIVNATGVFSDKILRMDNPEAENIVKPSQGIHLVLDKKFLPGDTALMIPKTPDGRVLFVVPWHDKLVVGTTDTPVQNVDLEPVPLAEEIDFILKTTSQYLVEAPQKSDVLSVYVGLRPLVASKLQKTKDVSRHHKIMTTDSGLWTIIGGKWTTYRKMGEDLVNQIVKKFNFKNSSSITKNLKIHGYSEKSWENNPFYFYGSDLFEIQGLIKENPTWGEKLHPKLNLNSAQIIWAIRQEMARQVEDVLARRTRCLFLDARASIEVAPQVAKIMAKELGKDENWQAVQIQVFSDLAKNYLLGEMSTQSLP